MCTLIAVYYLLKASEYHRERPNGTALTNSVESDLGCKTFVYFDTHRNHTNTLTSVIVAKQTINIPQ